MYIDVVRQMLILFEEQNGRMPVCIKVCKEIHAILKHECIEYIERQSALKRENIWREFKGGLVLFGVPVKNNPDSSGIFMEII